MYIAGTVCIINKQFITYVKIIHLLCASNVLGIFYRLYKISFSNTTTTYHIFMDKVKFCEA